MLMMPKLRLWLFACRPVLGVCVGVEVSGGLLLYIKKRKARKRGEGHSWFVWSVTEITANTAGFEFLIVCVVLCCVVCWDWVLRFLEQECQMRRRLVHSVTATDTLSALRLQLGVVSPRLCCGTSGAAAFCSHTLGWALKGDWCCCCCGRPDGAWRWKVFFFFFFEMLFLCVCVLPQACGCDKLGQIVSCYANRCIRAKNAAAWRRRSRLSGPPAVWMQILHHVCVLSAVWRLLLFHPCVCVCRCIDSISASRVYLEARCYQSLQPAAADSILKDPAAFHNHLLPFLSLFLPIVFFLSLHSPSSLVSSPAILSALLLFLPPKSSFPTFFAFSFPFSLCTLIATLHLPQTLIWNRRFQMYVFFIFLCKEPVCTV